MADTETTKSAPYVSYGIFDKSMEVLAETTVPTGPLDRRVLKGFSGADYGSLISALRFLGLIDEERRATATYRELVELWKEGKNGEHSDAFKEKFLVILCEKYAPVIGKLNLKQGTAAELEKCFKQYGVAQGQMLTKSIRFFLKATTEAGVTPSPHMTAPKPRAPRTINGTGKKGPEKVPPDREDSNQGVPRGYERLPLPGVPNSFIQYPANLTEAHCQILEAMVGVLKTSLKARTGGKEKTT